MRNVKAILLKDVKHYDSENVSRKGDEIYSDGVGWYSEKECKKGFIFGVYTFGSLEDIGDNPYIVDAILSLNRSIEGLKDGKTKDDYRIKLRKFRSGGTK